MTLSGVEFAFFSITLVGAIFLALYGIIANFLYDLRSLKQQKTYLSHPQRRCLRARPLITVFIYTHNDAAYIIRCLDSISHSSHRKWQVVIIDNASTDSTVSLVRQYIAEHPARKMQLIVKKRRVPIHKALVDASRRWPKSELCVNLTGRDVIAPDALRQAANYFALNKSTTDLVMACRPHHEYNLLAFWHYFSFTVLNWLRKANISSEKSAVSQFGVIRRNGRRVPLNSAYVAHISLQRSLQPYLAFPTRFNRSQGKRRHNLLLNVLNVVAVIILNLQTFLLPYLLYQVIKFSNPLFLVAYLSIFVVLAAIVIASDSALKLADKLMLVIHLPFLLGGSFVFSVHSVIVSCLHGLQSLQQNLNKLSLSLRSNLRPDQN